MVPPARHIDRERKVVRSATGEVGWDYGRGVVTVDTPRTQGAAGFLARAGRIELAAVAVESANDYGAILVTSLDGEPLASSTRILIQAMTEERHYGWRAEGGVIGSLGGYPLNVRDVDAKVTLKTRRRNVRATILDEHGYARGEARAESSGAGVVVRLPRDAMYTIVE